jgi:hypothetical protein
MQSFTSAAKTFRYERNAAIEDSTRMLLEYAELAVNDVGRYVETVTGVFALSQRLQSRIEGPNCRDGDFATTISRYRDFTITYGLPTLTN